MRKRAVFGNWKMNKRIDEARSLAAELRDVLGSESGVELAVFPPALALAAVARELEGCVIGTGSQNIHFETSGAFTGEVSAEMVLAAGAKYVIIGHSERRHIFGETDEWVNLKLKAALAAGLKPVVCVGEKLDEREAGKDREVVGRQLEAAFAGAGGDRAAGVIVAYEPVWAIGTGRTATPEQAQEMHSYIRGLLERRYGRKIASEMRIQYGGSVKPGNAAELLARDDVDGFLVGGASLDARSFADIAGAARR
jgi:triosephosphate isomerase